MANGKVERLLGTGDVVNNLTIDDTTGGKVAAQDEVYHLNNKVVRLSDYTTGATNIGKFATHELNRFVFTITNATIQANTNVPLATLGIGNDNTIVSMDVVFSHSSGWVSNTSEEAKVWLTDGDTNKILNVRQGHASIGTWDIVAIIYFY